MADNWETILLKGKEKEKANSEDDMEVNCYREQVMK